MPTPTLPGIWAEDQTLVEATDPQWLEGFQYLETTNNGKPRTYDLDYPLKKITEGLIWALNEIETMKNEQAESIGDVYYRAVDDAPSHSLYCDGSAVSRTTYADLFAKIGTTYGAGDGSTTFNVPDLRGEFIRGWDDGRGVDTGRTLGSSQGDAIRSITGSFNGIDISNESGATGVFESTVVVSTSAAESFGPDAQHHRIDFDISNQSPVADENRPRNVALKPFIRFK